jgi:hypothetical protein
MASPVLASDEGRGVWEEQLLALGIHREEASHHRPGAGLGPARARPRAPVEGVEPVVDRDLLVLGYRSPREDLDAVSHGVRIAGVVQVAPRRSEDGEAIESELAQVDPLPLTERRKLTGAGDAGVAPAKDELALSKVASGVDASPLCPGVSDLHVFDHVATLRGRQRNDPAFKGRVRVILVDVLLGADAGWWRGPASPTCARRSQAQSRPLW